MGHLLSDLRLAARSYLAHPGFPALSVGTLAIGIGASTAIFSVVYGILFRPLPLPDPGRLVTICETHASAGDYCTVSPPNLTDWAERSASFAAMGLARSNSFSMRSGGSARWVTGGLATPGFFRALGIAPLHGRLLTDEDMPPLGDGRAVLVTHAFWSAELGSDPGVVGTSLVLDGAAYDIVGVMPAAAEAPRLGFVRFWTPLSFDPRAEENRDWRGFVALARLAPGVELAAAQAELSAVQRGLAEAFPDAVAGWGVRVHALRDYLVGGSRPVLLLFFGAVAVLLLIVCVNMASLLFARTAARERDLILRAALGAERGTIIRQVLTESGLLALLGGAAGVLAAFWAVDAFLALAPAQIPRLDSVAVDGRVLLFALGVSGATALVFGVGPALRAARISPAAGLRAAGAATGMRSTQRIRRGLIIGEVALAVTLVSTAGLLARSFTGLRSWRPGFETGHLLTLHVFAPTERYPESAQVSALQRRAEQELAALPGVVSVGSVSAGPMFGGGDGATELLIEGRSTEASGAPSIAWFNVGPTWFRTLGVPIVRGRDLDETDRAGAVPVVLINEAAARRYWPDGDPIGARVRLPRLEHRAEVVGVVRDIAPFHPGEPPVPELYFSNRQFPRWAAFMVVRTAGEPGAIAGAAEAALVRVDPDLAPSSVRTLDAYMDEALVEPRFDAALIALLAFVALALGTAGLYAVMAHAVSLRTPEIGVRMALGARRSAVLLQVLREGLRLVVAGLALGLAGALLASRLIRGLLYGVRPADPWALGLTVVLLAAAGLAASIVPALRASRTDPLRALRAL